MSLKIMFYGINGKGLGHISRLLNVANVLKDISEALDFDTDFSFITTSDAPHLAVGYPVYKIPSGKDSQALRANARFFISNLFGSFRPDVVVMDTNPAGSFMEFPLFREYCKRSVFINRHADSSGSESDPRAAYFPLYDLIITPDSEENRSKYHLSSELKNHSFAGIVHGFREDVALSRNEVREYFKLKDGQKLIYISAGGGGDSESECQIKNILTSLAGRADLKLLVGYGPLYRGSIDYQKITFHIPVVMFAVILEAWMPPYVLRGTIHLKSCLLRIFPAHFSLRLKAWIAKI